MYVRYFSMLAVAIRTFALAYSAGYNRVTYKDKQRDPSAVSKQRPKNLNLFSIRLPIPAIVSILHRISGVILFLLIPFLLWGLNLSLSSPEDFDELHLFLTSPLMKLLIWGCLSAFIYHFVAGIRHLLMDVHLGENLQSGRLSAKLTLFISIVMIILVGIWLW